MVYSCAVGVCAGQDVGAEVEQAVARGLVFLSREQGADGAFGGEGPRVAMTGLSLLAYLSAGHVPEVGRHGATVRAAVDYLLAEAPVDGYFGKVDGSRMYGQGIVTLALAEAYGVEPDVRRRARMREVLERSVEVILEAQAVHKEPQHAGGWRYERDSEDSDLSLSGWNVLGLRACQNIGITTPSLPIEQAAAYVLRCFREEEGGFAYQPGRRATVGMTGVGVVALSLMDEGEREEVVAGAEFLRENPVGVETRFEHYAMYYVVQAAWQAGEPTWCEVWPGIRQRLLAGQMEDGGWPESGDEREPGRVYSTAMSVLTLTAPYRLLPIHQR